MKRYELEEHQDTKESKHTQLQLNFALTKLSVMEKERMEEGRFQICF